MGIGFKTRIKEGSGMMAGRIDRQTVVRRHNPVLFGVHPTSPLAVGNGEFAYTVDVTGMQSFEGEYRAPLSTQSQWGWHVSKADGDVNVKELSYQVLASDPRGVGYPLRPEGDGRSYHWKRQNPHRLQLGQVGLRVFAANGQPLDLSEFRGAVQTLDLWTGTITSRWVIDGHEAIVQTCCHPDRDQIGVRISGRFVNKARWAIMVRFPSVDCWDDDWRQDTRLRWDGQERHRTGWRIDGRQVAWTRDLGTGGYRMRAKASSWQAVEQTGAHAFLLHPFVSDAKGAFELVFGFAPDGREMALESFDAIRDKSRAHWASFWNHGGAVDFSESRDVRAAELERRVVLSQYLTAIHGAGSLPPQETGLAYNSWYGKFHLEMTWWHAVHFFLWQREDLAFGSLAWYQSQLPKARDLARSQGFRGARWPKTVGPDGEQSPSSIAPLLIWQQPHPIFLAELAYRRRPIRETLTAFREVVHETATFMADFAAWEASAERYVLPPPLIPVQETHDPEKSLNPAFELEYWHQALGMAIRWEERLGARPPESWRRVRERLAPLPILDGVYLAHEGCVKTFTAEIRDHPSMLGAFGILKGARVDRQVMARTLDAVLRSWRFETLWGWDFAMMAMTAARLGAAEKALDILLKASPKNRYLENGHNDQGEGLWVYLPGNGGLLTAVAMMAAGWSGSPVGRKNPGFPANGKWSVAWEDLSPWI